MNKKKKPRYLYIIILLIVFLISYTIGLMMGECPATFNVMIPNSEMIHSFCKDNNFDNGWLSSSSCGINEIQCHRKVGNYDEYKCIKWEN